jgi:hypothetical protein
VAPPLNPVERALKRIFAELGDAGVPCALIGGLAVSARAEPRTTRDVDVAISADGDAAAEQLVFHLQNRGYVVATLLEQEKTDRSRRCVSLETANGQCMSTFSSRPPASNQRLSRQPKNSRSSKR